MPFYNGRPVVLPDFEFRSCVCSLFGVFCKAKTHRKHRRFAMKTKSPGTAVILLGGQPVFFEMVKGYKDAALRLFVTPSAPAKHKKSRLSAACVWLKNMILTKIG